MNRIYRLVWCRARGALVAVSELAHSPRVEVGPGQAGRLPLLLSAIALGIAGILHGPAAHAQSASDAKLADLQSLVDKYSPAPAAGGLSAAARVQLPPVVSQAQADASVLPAAALHADAAASTPVAAVRAKLRADRRGATIHAGLDTRGLASGLSTVTHAASTLPVAGTALSAVDGLAGAIVAAVPPMHVGVGATVGAPAVVEPLAADRRRVLVSGQVHASGMAAEGHVSGVVTGGAGGVVGGVADVVTDTASKLPVAGPVVAQLGQALGTVTSAGGHPVGVVGGAVDAVTDTASKLPVAGPVVAQVGQALGTVTSGGGHPSGVVGGVVDAVTDAASKLPAVGPVVGQLSGDLASVTSGHGDPGTVLGTVVGGGVNTAAGLPVVGSTVASAGQALKTATSGGSLGGGLEGQLGVVAGDTLNTLAHTPGAGPVVAKVGQTLGETTAPIGGGTTVAPGLTAAVGKVVDGATGTASKLPVLGSTVGKLGDALKPVTSGDGNAAGALGAVIGDVTDPLAKLPVAGPLAGQIGGTLASVASGNGSATGLVGQAVEDVTDTASQLPVAGPVVGQLGQTLGAAMNTAGAGNAGLFGPVNNLLSLASPGTASITPAAVPVVPPPSATPSGLIIGNGGVVGTSTQLLGSSESSLFTNSNPKGYITNGSLQVSNANFSQGYSTLNLLGLPVLNSTPVGTVLTTTGGTTLGATGANSHLTLIGGVTSGNYISDINNGADGGTLGLVLPTGAPAWASTCLNVLGVLRESCWAVNAAQDYQVLMGDGASANGSEEVVIGTNASHTLPTVNANTAFPGNGANDPNNPSGVPTADYAARLGHSVVIGDSASGTANAQTILGAGATSSVANSVALGFDSIASRGALANYSAPGLTVLQNSAGEVSIGSPGQERQITNLAAGSAATDAVNLAQLQGAIGSVDAVQYTDSTHALVTLAGPASTDGGATGGTTITNLHQGSLSATSTDAVNGAQLFGTNTALTKYMGGTTNFDPTTGNWTAPTFTITSVATDGSTTKGNYADVTDAFAAVDGSMNNLNSRINNIDTGGSKYFQANSTGTAASAQGTDSVAIGPDSVASGVSSIAMGKGATATAGNALAIGVGAVAQNGSAVSVGAGNTAAGNGAVAMGDPNTATGQGAVALGYNNQATGQGTIAMGSTSVANGASAIALGDSANASANNALAFGAGAQASMANSIALGAGSVTSVGALSNYTAYALTTPQNSTGEVNVGGRQITGLAAGSAAGDAVNVAQLQAVANSVQGTDKLAVKYNADVSGNATNTIGLVGSGSGSVLITNLAPGAESATSTDAVNGSQLWHWTQDTTNQYSNYSLYNAIQNIQPGGGGSVKYFSVNSTLANSSASGSNSVAIGPQATSSGTGSVAMGNGANASANNSVAIGAGSVANRANTVSVGSAGNERQITNVAAGTAATDAVNVGQLDSAVQSSTAGTVRYDTSSNGSVDYGNITLGNGNAGTVIHNVGAGTAQMDAVNVGQLQSGMQQAVNWANAYTDHQVQELGNRANAGVAAALAAAGLPQAYEPGKSMAAMAGGSFRGESSIAIGVSTISEGGRWVYKLTGSADSRGDAGVSIGAGIQW